MGKKAILIEIRWDDGSVSRVEAEAATKIMDWYGACEGMNCTNGAVYSGPHFEVIPGPREAA